MALSDMIGLGVTIALTDAFTRGAEGVIAKFREMATEATGSTAAGCLIRRVPAYPPCSAGVAPPSG